MIDDGKKNLLGILVNAIDYNAAVLKIITAAIEQKPFAVTALAVHGVMTGVLDNEIKFRLNHFDLVTPDGQPVRWGLNCLYNTKLKGRVYGPTLTLKVCQEASRKNLPVFLYGSSAKVLDHLSRNLQKNIPGIIIAGKQSSFFRIITEQEKSDLIHTIVDSGARIVMVGLGCPRQEIWIYEFREHLSMPLLAVGAAFDFHAGLKPQAPPFLQANGLEWVFRLVKEPRRLWKRYLTLNPLYVLALTAQKFKIARFDPLDAVKPGTDLNLG